MPVALEDYLGIAGRPVTALERSPAGPAPFWKRLTAVAAWLRVEHVATEPGIATVTELSGERAHGSIRLRGDIAGRQLEPLVETLRALATGRPEFDTPATPSRLSELGRDVEVLVAVSATCPFCPRVAAAALRFACASVRVWSTVVRADLGLAPDAVQSVPSVLTQGRVVATGSIGEYDLLEAILATDGPLP